jgi:hypothetical protein
MVVTFSELIARSSEENTVETKTSGESVALNNENGAFFS